MDALLIHSTAQASPDQSQTPASFSLKEIASWTPGVCQSVKPRARASVPALQRGLVWKPQQNELLWDSILRGFPIGALVVTRWSEALKKTAESSDGHPTYHLLDGQQRCHAIALGFSDPFSTTSPGSDESPILWLDLEPSFAGNSTRNFLIRATTSAHPWGYQKDDNALPLQAHAIRGALGRLGIKTDDPDYRRPAPSAIWPAEEAATTPVPLAWLLALPTDDERFFWDALSRRAEGATNLKWVAKIREFCANSRSSTGASRIFNGIRRAHVTRVIALEAPELDEASAQEDANGDERQGVSNMEQLFQRLNRQGTPLDGEELAYSMIKAYWPELESPIDAAAERRMPQARMVSLGVRTALADGAKASIPGQPSVSSLRAIAKNEHDKKQVIQGFVGNELKLACDAVDQWLKYHPKTNAGGLLPVHVTSIAMGSREVYVLLLHFANRLAGKDTPANWHVTMLALATLVHWFAPEKSKVVNRIFASCKEGLDAERISLALVGARQAGELHPVHSPEAVGHFINLDGHDLKKWSWGVPLHGDGNEDGIRARWANWGGFLDFRSNRELLLYAQREFMAARFHDYDPARRDLWEDHNRPWDFDHILAHKYFYNRKDGSEFREACSQWGWTIGNLRAWPFEDNRSEQAETARGKLSVDGELDLVRVRNSRIIPEHVDAFSGGEDARREPEIALKFVKACRERLLEIYGEWYHSVQMERLFPPPSSPAEAG